jgi:iron complex outermembrane receptor protein
MSGVITTESTAIFAHATWNISDSWTLDFGARWTEDERGFHQTEVATTHGTCIINGANGNANPIGAPTSGGNHQPNDGLPATGNNLPVNICQPEYILSFTNIFEEGFYNDTGATFDEITPMISLSYNFEDGNMMYGLISTGFLSGSFNDELNTILVPEAAPLLTYKPETVTNYEVGYKGTFADGRVSLAASLFFMDYTDKQEALNIDNSDGRFGADPDINIVTNAATVEITGLEFEFRASPWDGGFITVDLGLLDDEFSEYLSDDLDNPGSSLDLSNVSRETYSADWTLNATIEHAFELGNGGSITPLLGVYSQDDYDFFEQLVDSPPSFCNQGSYAKFRARATYADPTDTWQASIYGFNITDERYYEWCDDSRSGTYAYRYGAPQTYGVEFSYSF